MKAPLVGFAKELGEQRRVPPFNVLAHVRRILQERTQERTQ
jgi:hypothetical protein